MPTTMDLRTTRAKDLDRFIEDQLLPDTAFRTEVKQAIDLICEFLKAKCFQGAPHPVRVSKVVKGGSSGKGTALRGRSDADLVVFLTNLRSFEEQISRRGEFIAEIRKRLEEYQLASSNDELHIRFEPPNPKWANPRVLSFVLSSPRFPGRMVEFDVLPAHDALGQVTKNYRPDPEIYIRLIKECTSRNREGEFSTCFTELQKAFVKCRPTKLKSLIRLVKHWYQLCKQKLGGPLPAQYALELLTIYAWENGSGQNLFNTAEGFKTVLELVVDHKQLCVFWTQYYDFKNSFIKNYLMEQLGKPRPVILDPADPTGNLGGKNPEGWRRLAQEAKAWMSYPCFRLWDDSLVSSWCLDETAMWGYRKPQADYEAHQVFWQCEHRSPHPGPDFPRMTAPQDQQSWCTVL
ncbi:2'-5'-oligoadenylate synthase 1 [Cavia porcellus]|uniref:2'-5' oligoadenylate synthase n=1 Tax=Cavia porcellus TaxID=10141 RepID=A0A286X8S4_CAVPO|nr:2'-5'-oligoadenylate synthase 1 [Cavia porcellus]